MMKKRNLILTISLLVMMLVAGCNLPKATPENGGSLTQVALFAQATLTKFAQLQEETPVPTQETKDDTVTEPSMSRGDKLLLRVRQLFPRPQCQ
jgi:hypothetical protein